MPPSPIPLWSTALRAMELMLSVCLEGWGAVMGFLGVIAYFGVCGKYNMSFPSHPHLVFRKHSPHKQHVFSQSLLSFPEPLAGFQKPIIIIIIKNLRTEPFVPKIHLHVELFEEEQERAMSFHNSGNYWMELLRHFISFLPVNFLNLNFCCLISNQCLLFSLFVFSSSLYLHFQRPNRNLVVFPLLVFPSGIATGKDKIGLISKAPLGSLIWPTPMKIACTLDSFI